MQAYVREPSAAVLTCDAALLQLVQPRETPHTLTTPTPHMLVCSEPSLPPSARTALVSPPRGWPQCFAHASLKRFCSRTLKGKRVRLVDCTPEVDSGCGNKPVIGFAIAECEAKSGVYVATPLTWFEHAPTGRWMCKGAKGSQKVLVESALTPVAATEAALAASAAIAQAVAATDAATEVAEAKRSDGDATQAASVDISDSAEPSHAPTPALAPAPAPAASTAADPPSEGSPPAPAARAQKRDGPLTNVNFLWRSRDEVRASHALCRGRGARMLKPLAKTPRARSCRDHAAVAITLQHALAARTLRRAAARPCCSCCSRAHVARALMPLARSCRSHARLPPSAGADGGA